MKKTLIILVIIALIINITIGLVIILKWGSPYYENSPRENEITKEMFEGSQRGIIKGSLSYPSEYIPSLEICAEDIYTFEEYCTYEMIQNYYFTYGMGYELEVPEGMYYVYSKLADQEFDYRAYYTEFVTCGLDISCPSHAPIAVRVDSGLTTDFVDPIDWYDY